MLKFIDMLHEERRIRDEGGGKGKGDGMVDCVGKMRRGGGGKGTEFAT